MSITDETTTSPEGATAPAAQGGADSAPPAGSSEAAPPPEEPVAPATAQGGAESAPLVEEGTASTLDPWADADPAWSMDPKAVTAVHLAGVAARRRSAGPALLRDALLLGRVRRHLVAANQPTKWVDDATGYSRRRLQEFRQLADSLDGLVAGVVVKDAIRTSDGLVEPPARWLDLGVDEALAEVRKLASDAQAASDAAVEQAAREQEAALPEEKRKELAITRALAQVGKDAWKEDQVAISEALHEHPTIADVVVDALVALVVESVKVLPRDTRVAVLRRAHRAVGAAVKEARIEEAPATSPEPDVAALEAVVETLQGDE